MNTSRAFAGVAAALTLMIGAFAGTASSSADAGMAQEVRVREGIGQTRTKGWSVATLNGAPGLYRDGKPVAPVFLLD